MWPYISRFKTHLKGWHFCNSIRVRNCDIPSLGHGQCPECDLNYRYARLKLVCHKVKVIRKYTLDIYIHIHEKFVDG